MTETIKKRAVVGEKLRGEEKLARIPIKIQPAQREQLLRKPKWIRASYTGTVAVQELKKVLRKNKLHTVCEEAACPNLGECFTNGTATFLIMGDICTRRCPFCDVAHGRPKPLDQDEPQNLARTIAAMKLRYVVLTSVDRDDLRDGGADHFRQCIQAIRQHNPEIQIEVLTPDFRGRLARAVDILGDTDVDVFNHNLETVPRLYKEVRPGSDYQHSLDLLQSMKQVSPTTPTKSGLMLGLGETHEEVIEVMRDLREHQTDIITLGQYLQPSRYHLKVVRYWTPAEFDELAHHAYKLGFSHAAAGPMVRSSYHADQQAHQAKAQQL